MAQKRMFDKTITNDDCFLEMPIGSQVLYFHLSMNADDDGFINNWRSIMKMTGSKEDDLKVLIAKSYVIPFDTGVIVIKHWKINNYLRSDRYKPTRFQNEYSQLTTDDDLVYQLDTNGIHSIDKNRIEKNSIDYKEENIKEEIVCDEDNSKHKFGEYKHVLLTNKELETLKENFPNYEELIKYLDEYIEMKGYKAKSHYLAIRKWVVNAVKEAKIRTHKLEEKKPEWFDKELHNEKLTKEDEEEIDNLLDDIYSSIDNL